MEYVCTVSRSGGVLAQEPQPMPEALGRFPPLLRDAAGGLLASRTGGAVRQPVPEFQESGLGVLREIRLADLAGVRGGRHRRSHVAPGACHPGLPTEMTLEGNPLGAT